MTFQWWEIRSCGKACPKDNTRSVPMFSDREICNSWLKLWDFQDCNPAMSLYQFNNHFKEINIFNYFFFYKEPLQQPHNTLKLPSEPSGSNNPSARADPQHSNSSSCRFWLNFPRATFSEMHMTGFCSPQKINWKIFAEQTSKTRPCFQLTYKP